MPPAPFTWRPPRLSKSAAGHGPHDQERFGSPGYGVRQLGVGQLVGQILLTGEEPDKRSALLRDLIADRTAQHRIAGLEGVEHRALGRLTLHLQLHLADHLRQFSQMCREHDANHGSVWTSTDSTAGRFRTIGAQLSPASADAYTWPPLVPK